MNFRTEIALKKMDRLINHADPILTIGSCFAENMGRQLEKLKFNILNNPFGVLYNPASIAASLELLLKTKKYMESDLVVHDGEWHSFYHHSSFSNQDPSLVIERINTRLEETKDFIQKSKFIIITLGTSFVFKYKKTGLIVSNCHKIPADRFEQILLGRDNLLQFIGRIIEIIHLLNPSCKIIFSVSPIRHVKDGLQQSQLSKSLLIVAVHEALGMAPNLNYFPAYEIMMDDLRDYRFYEANLTHPNEMAIQYIWDKFSESCLSDSCRQALKDIEKMNHALSHRVRNPGTEAHRAFLENQVNQLKHFKKKYSYLNFDQEASYFRSQLKSEEMK